ncbi:MAG: hypothetical protein KDA96_20085, partial [Planctomycetaceae bacterium]|nr:hypothetical protein [Planctomycetaceae bacterium]
MNRSSDSNVDGEHSFLPERARKSPVADPESFRHVLRNRTIRDCLKHSLPPLILVTALLSITTSPVRSQDG